MFNWCIHRYEAKVVKGFQFCKKCKKARYVGCFHHWKTIEIRDRYVGFENRGSVYILECKHCKTVAKRDLSHYNNYEV